jgi:hypothetical protein
MNLMFSMDGNGECHINVTFTGAFPTEKCPFLGIILQDGVIVTSLE